MDFDWPPETRARIDRFEKIGATLAARAAEPGGFDRAGWGECTAAGVFAPYGVGGEGPPGDLRGAVADLEALGRGGAGRGLLFALGAHLFGCQIPLRIHADDAQRGLWLEQLTSGARIGALAVTEPQGGSDPGQNLTRAEPDGGGFVLTGHKTLVTNAPVADLFLVIASSAPDRGSFGWTAFLVPKETPGMHITPIEAPGLSGAPMGELILDGCTIGPDHRIGPTGGGLRVFTSAMLWERTGILAGFIAATRRDLDAAVHHVNTRRSGGLPLSARQSLAHRLAGARIRLERARLLILQAAWAVDTGQRNVQALVAMAKQDAAQALVETSLDLVRTGAGATWRGELPGIEGLIDSLGTLSASGTAEIQLDIVAAAMGLKRK